MRRCITADAAALAVAVQIRYNEHSPRQSRALHTFLSQEYGYVRPSRFHH